MPPTQTISASEFKAKCLNILDRLDSHELDRVVITKRGKPVAILSPTVPAVEAAPDLYGFMRGSAIIADGADLTAPILDEPLTAENGDLHG